jgi:two-component system sensor histidine kinase DegS
MKNPDVGPGVLDDNVQKNIASLEHARERIARIAEAAREQYDAISRDIGLLAKQQPASAGQTSEWEQRALAATAKLKQLAEGGAPAADLVDAAGELAEAKAGLIAAQSAAVWLEQLATLQAGVERLAEIAEDSEHLTDEVAIAIDYVATNFRELGSCLETAQQSRALGLHIIRAQEEERRRLAREIHDGPTQLLNSVVLRIDVCQRFFDSDLQRLKDELQQLKELVRLSLQDVRKIIFDLRPMALDDLGVVPALRTFLKDYQARTGIEADFSVFGNDRRYDPAFEIAIFRIVQEALTNVFKHAGASRVWVKVETAGGNQIKVQVKDDGAGFDPAQVKPGAAGTKFGLVAMRERTELLGGTMDIQSAPGQGTKLNFIFPLPE